VTKQWTAKWPYIANAVFWIVKMMVKEVTFAGFRGAISHPGSAVIYQRVYANS